MLEQLGGMDENLCIYAEDLDLCLRARQLGFKVVGTSKASAYHRYYEKRRQGPPPYQVFYSTRNRIYCAQKFFGRAAKWRVIRESVFLRFVRRGNVRRVVQRGGKLEIVKAYYLGILYGALGIMGKQLFLE
jgi:GT2 family glycosyltransferase